MARQLTMNLDVEHLKKQYVGATKKEKARLLDELCELTGIKNNDKCRKIIRG